MAENDIKALKELASGGFREITLTAADISAAATTHASSHATGGSDPLTPANIGAAKDFTEIEVPNTGTSTTTLTTAQLPARVILFVDSDDAPTATINLPTPDARQSGLIASIKLQVETGAADTVLITVVHNAVNLLSSYSLAEDEGTIDFRWDGYRWVYDANWLLRSSTGRVLQLPSTSGTIALTESADTLFRVVGSSDATKKVAFEVDTLVDAATTRTLTVPNSSGTIALLGSILASNLSGAFVLAPTADASTTSTTPANVTGLSFTAVADRTYLIAACMQLDIAASGGGYVLAASTPAAFGPPTSSAAAGTFSATTSAAGVAAFHPSSTELRLLRATAAQTSGGLVGPNLSLAMLRCTAGGTVNFNWALVGASANASTLKAESRILVLPLI
jgi:hypothetical protein